MSRQYRSSYFSVCVLVLLVCFCTSLVSCTKLKIKKFNLTEDSNPSSTTPTGEESSPVWLVKDVVSSNAIAANKITLYSTKIASSEITPYKLTLTDLQEGDVVHIYADLTLVQTLRSNLTTGEYAWTYEEAGVYRSYVQASIKQDKSAISSKKITVDRELKYAHLNLIGSSKITKKRSSLTYSVGLKLYAEQGRWSSSLGNGDDSVTVTVDTKQNGTGGIYAVVYRQYKIKDILQDDNTPYYLAKAAFPTTIATKDVSCGDKVITLDKLDLRENDLVLLQGQLTTKVPTGITGTSTYDFNINLVTAQKTFVIPRYKNRNIAGLMDSTKFFTIFRQESGEEDTISLHLSKDSPNECTFATSRETSHMSALVFRKATIKNLKEDGGNFYYLISPEEQDYQGVFSKKLPVQVKVEKNKGGKYDTIYSYNIGSVLPDDIFDVKLDSSFSHDYSTDESHQYTFIYMFKFLKTGISSQQSKAMFIPPSMQHYVNAKQDVSLYFAARAGTKEDDDNLTLRTSIVASDGAYNKYLNLETFFILFQHWRNGKGLLDDELSEEPLSPTNEVEDSENSTGSSN